MYRMDGPAPIEDKILHLGLKAKGVKIPKELQDEVVAKTREGAIGSIIFRRMSGLQNNGAKRLMNKFEENIGGKDELADKLTAIEDSLNKEQKRLLALLRVSNQRGLSRLLAESGAEPVGVLKAYARGCIELGKIDAAIEAHRNLPALIKDLYCMALSKKGVCDACGGTGKLLKTSQAAKETRPCYFCGETGILDASALKQFATQKLLEVTKQIGEKGPLVNVQTNVGVKIDGKGSFLERMVSTSDQILYNQPIEAEIVTEQPTLEVAS